MKSHVKMRSRPRISRGAARTRGFTLIELMIVVSVVGILSAIAYPSYISYVQRSNRAAAKTALAQAAQYMERQFTINNSYPTSISGTIYTGAPLNSAQQNYTLALSTTGTPPTAFVLTATPSSSNVDPTCGVLRLDNLDNQRAVGNAVTATATAVDTTCWQK